MRSIGKKGFTLVEIIVVMVVVGILAAIMVPSLGKYIDNGKKRDCDINRKAPAGPFVVGQSFGSRSDDG